jgi:hypothetical protein
MIPRVAVVLAMLLASACAGAKESRMVKIIGTVASCDVVDLSKTAGVPNLYTRVKIAVEKADDARLTGEIELQKKGSEKIEKGARVEATTSLMSNWRPGEKLTLYEIKKL